MAKFLGIFYMTLLFVFCIWYMIFSVCDWIDRMKKKRITVNDAEKEPEKHFEPVIDVVGKSTTAFLAPLIPAKIKPVMSEDLEMESDVQTEPDILPEEVEDNLNSFVLDDDELEQYRNDDMDLSGEFSQGLTYQQISQAIDVVQGKKSGESEEIAAGETFSFMPTDFLDMICAQVEHESIVKRLISCYVDSVGKVKPVPALVANFDINQYV